MGNYLNYSLENIEGEEWKDVEGYEGRYMASSKGRIKSLPKTVTLWHGSAYTTKEKILRQRKCGDDYLFIALFNGKNINRFDIQAHIIIARTFKTNPLNKKEVNHLDGDKTNNDILNLEWATHSENIQHGWDTGLFGKDSKLVQCLCTGRRMKVREAAKELMVGAEYMWAMLSGGRFNWTNFIYV